VDGLPAGFAKLKKHSLNEQLDFLFQAELQKLYVLKRYQGKGIGNTLMQSVIKSVGSIDPDCLWLDTHISNERAIRFYQRHGFYKEGSHQFTIGTQTFDYFLMALPIAISVAH
jgi:ribosomal protein S18 acetylase RimI-like enzyme